ncbi:hypothetical protein, partial [Citrobacter freundii]
IIPLVMLLISKLLAYFFNETFNLRLEFAGFLMPFCDENIISHLLSLYSISNSVIAVFSESK